MHVWNTEIYLKDKTPQINIDGRQHFTQSSCKIKKMSENR